MKKELESSGIEVEQTKTISPKSSSEVFTKEVQATDLSGDREPIGQEEPVLNQADVFDLQAFFQSDDQTVDAPQAGKDQMDSTSLSESEGGAEQANEAPRTIVFSLRDDAQRVIATFSTKVDESNYKTGAKMTSEAFSLLGILAQSCGAFCMHGAQMLSAVPSSGGVGLPSLSSMGGGELRVDGHIDAMSSATGLSRSRLLTNDFSMEEALRSVYDTWQGLLKVNLGFVEMFTGSLFHAFRPDGNNQSSSDWSGVPAGAGV